MIDWSKSMTQTFEYYTVDTGTWKDDKKINNVKKSTITRDLKTDTLGSSTIDIVDTIGEKYVRTYLIAKQNGNTYKIPLGTHLVQSPSTTFDGFTKNVSMDAYTPIIELKENQPPIGYSLLKGTNIMSTAYQICRENMRAPIVIANSDDTLYQDFISNTNDTWVTFITDLISNAKYELDLDELGRVLFKPKQDTASLQPVWTYTDDNSSILYSDITIDQDLYGIPNIVEVTYSNGSDFFYKKVINDDPNSPLSIANRGRKIIHRVNNPNLLGDPTKYQIDEYANQLLRDLSSLEYTVSYKHGYCPVRLGDCVRLNYSRAGLNNIKAKVINQTINCEAGCTVTEKAVFTVKLWG